MVTTVTLNPAVDRIVTSGPLEIGEANRVERTGTLAAGKGVDVAKVLGDMGRRVYATGFYGGIYKELFDTCFAEAGIHNEFITIPGDTRVNVQIFSSDGTRTELLEKGPEIPEQQKREFLVKIKALSNISKVVTLCGSAPIGIDKDYYLQIMKLVKSSGCKLIVDASNQLLQWAIEGVPDLIKPNKYEMRTLMGNMNASDDEIISYALELVDKGISYIVISMGENGSVLVCREGVYRAKPLHVDVKTTLGCGDTVVASMAMSICDGDSPSEMLKKASALSTANCLTFETAHVLKEDYLSLLEQAEVTKIR